MKTITTALLSVLFAFASLTQTHAQNVLASSTISGTEIGTSGTYNYTLTLTALTGSYPIESFWFAWTPGNFFLQSTPSSITGDNGWTGAGDSGSIQFTGGTPITAGNTVTFTFVSTITPAEMTADVGTASSVVYPGAITFSGTSPNETIGVQTVTPPAATDVLASSTITSTPGTAGAYNYTLTLTALTNSAPIESFWFAWTPGNFFLQSTPTSITGDNGWTGAGNSGSIQFTGGTPITAGNTVTFTFVSTITPDEMTADVGTASSVVYPGVITFSGTSPNETIGVQTIAAAAPTNVLASSTITSTPGTAGTFNYTLTLTALTNSAPIESFWFAWVPGSFFLQSTPTSITGDNGWTGAGDSGSIQFTGGTPITAGNTVTFTFVSPITPDEMTADVGTASSVVYPGVITFSGDSPNETIGVQTIAAAAPTNVLATSTISGTEIGTNGTYNYTLTLTALTNSAPIESFWFAWTPGNFFLQSTPTAIAGDNGWTGAGDSGSIQFTGGTPITAGNTVTFTFVTTITPDEMAADVGTNSSVVYPGAITFSGTSPNETIGVQTVTPPAPTNVLASSTISGTAGTGGMFNYTLTLTALAGSAPIESYWFAWTPGNFFLQSTPTNITGDNAWTGVGDSGSIQFTGGTPITAGNTVTFTFVTTITPDEMTADVGTNSSVVYPGVINFSGTSPNETIGVQTVTPPAPTNVLASSTISGTAGTGGTFNYTLTLTALTGSAPIESYWFAWTPGNFFLQSTPTNIAGDNGWTGVGDTGSIQFTGGTPITAGNTVTLTFVSTVTPSQMTADVGTNSSVVYPGAITFSGTSPNETIGVQTVTTPPPPPAVMLGVTNTSSALDLTWNSEVGKSYQLQSSADLTQTNWTASGAPIAGTGSPESVTNIPTTGQQKFYRLMVQP